MSTGNGKETQIPVRCPLIRRPVRLDHGQDCDIGWTQLHVLQRVQAPGPGQGRDAAGGEEDSDGEQRGWHRGDCHHEHPPRGHRQVTAVHLHHTSSGSEDSDVIPRYKPLRMRLWCTPTSKSLTTHARFLFKNLRQKQKVTIMISFLEPTSNNNH